MARGWESKSVEAQQEEAAGPNTSGKPRLSRQEADFVRYKESLMLSLKRIMEQLARSQNSQHREMLERAKVDLEEKISKLIP